MNIKEFDRKYGSKGGIKSLTEFRSLLFTQGYIANHFGVGKERVRQWMLEFFGSPYDPRPERRETILENMVEFARHNKIEDFDFAFKGTAYYKDAMTLCVENKIYDVDGGYGDKKDSKYQGQSGPTLSKINKDYGNEN